MLDVALIIFLGYGKHLSAEVINFETYYLCNEAREQIVAITDERTRPIKATCVRTSRNGGVQHGQ